MTKDYLIEIKVKNNWLYQKIMQNGYDSVAQLCKKHNLSPNRVGQYLSLKMAPTNSKGMWRTDFIKLSGVLNCLPEDICPPQHIKNVLKKNRAKLEASIEEVAVYLTGNFDTSVPAIDHMIQEENLDVIRESLHLLTPREERVLRMRYGLFGDETEHTLEQVGDLFEVSRERVRQIEAKALRKLRYISLYKGNLEKKGMENHLRTAAASMGIYYRDNEERKSRHYIPEWKRQELENTTRETDGVPADHS